jgi:hypothetical protein
MIHQREFTTLLGGDRVADDLVSNYAALAASRRAHVILPQCSTHADHLTPPSHASNRRGFCAGLLLTDRAMRCRPSARDYDAQCRAPRSQIADDLRSKRVLSSD